MVEVFEHIQEIGDVVRADHAEDADLVHVELKVRALHPTALKHFDCDRGAIGLVLADVDLPKRSFSNEPLLTHIKVIVFSDVTSLSGGTQAAKPSVRLLLSLKK